VPQRPQKLRFTAGLELNRTGSPAVNRRLAMGTLNQATVGVPAIRRQSGQWQIVA
jgi:hypothetical protein